MSHEYSTDVKPNQAAPCLGYNHHLSAHCLAFLTKSNKKKHRQLVSSAKYCSYATTYFTPLLLLSSFSLPLSYLPCTYMHSRCLLLIQFQPISLLVAIETAMLNGSPMNFHHDIFTVAVGTMKTAP